MRLLLVPYYFAPAGGPRSIRWSNIARYMAMAGHELTVVAAGFSEACPWMDPSLLEVADVPNITVHRLPVANCSPGRRENLEWMRTARRKIEELGSPPFEAVISSAVPIASHAVVAGLSLPKQTPWIADYGDPWSQSASRVRSLPIRLLETVYERRILRRADALTITTPSAVDAFTRVFPRKDAIHVIPQGASYFHLSADWTVRPERKGPLRILYAGGFYAGVREPTALFQALAQVEGIELTIVGHSQVDLRALTEKYRIGDRVQVLPYADIREIVRMQQESEWLLLLSWPVEEQIPGKFWEYMATSRKILYATYHPDDFISQTIHRQNAGHVAGHSTAEIAEGLRTILRERESGVSVQRSPDPTVGFDARARDFLELIKRLRTRNGP